MTSIVVKQKQRTLRAAHELLRGKKRLSVWQNIRGMWKGRKPDSIKELKRIRKEWERTLK